MFDPDAYKRTTRDQWEETAEAWHRWARRSNAGSVPRPSSCSTRPASARARGSSTWRPGPGGRRSPPPGASGRPGACWRPTSRRRSSTSRPPSRGTRASRTWRSESSTARRSTTSRPTASTPSSPASASSTSRTRDARSAGSARPAPGRACLGDRLLDPRSAIRSSRSRSGSCGGSPACPRRSRDPGPVQPGWPRRPRGRLRGRGLRGRARGRGRRAAAVRERGRVRRLRTRVVRRAAHAMLTGVDEAGRDQAWRQIERRPPGLRGSDGFEGPCELLVGTARRPA